ncbi:hypothetical protein FA95DRAFT_235390 [Auriscalpium vulgare]|uniref:Uncharacterized protein n=1 Tax=Auriscalpium vulgare TaxID=40419 RepID=A0ACB8S6J8_9AGAM|nr:hypothetical protein FA95DRAFT_235390 [Auriscalpium vulgare]
MQMGCGKRSMPFSSNWIEHACPSYSNVWSRLSCRTGVQRRRRRQRARQRRQLTATYAFADYPAQGQTILYVRVDVASPPLGSELCSTSMSHSLEAPVVMIPCGCWGNSMSSLFQTTGPVFDVRG